MTGDLFPRLAEPLGDIDFGDDNATAWNRAACGMVDVPAERELTGVDLLAIVNAETFVNALAVEWRQRSTADGTPFPPDTEDDGRTE
jgi:hypothetical protein